MLGIRGRCVSKAALAHLTRILDVELPPAQDPGERGRAAAHRHARQRGIRAGGIPAHAVSSEAITAVIAFLVSDAAALVSGAIIQAYGTRPTA
jgi:NAD(P)-dependent dehydrogenase (short-subunit alcohol dehydrogenase family)